MSSIQEYKSSENENNQHSSIIPKWHLYIKLRRLKLHIVKLQPGKCAANYTRTWEWLGKWKSLRNWNQLYTIHFSNKKLRSIQSEKRITDRIMETLLKGYICKYLSFIHICSFSKRFFKREQEQYAKKMKNTIICHQISCIDHVYMHGSFWSFSRSPLVFRDFLIHDNIYETVAPLFCLQACMYLKNSRYRHPLGILMEDIISK